MFPPSSPMGERVRHENELKILKQRAAKRARASKPAVSRLRSLFGRKRSTPAQPAQYGKYNLAERA
jgi:hypothetical protein